MRLILCAFALALAACSPASAPNAQAPAPHWMVEADASSACYGALVDNWPQCQLSLFCRAAANSFQLQTPYHGHEKEGEIVVMHVVAGAQSFDLEATPSFMGDGRLDASADGYFPGDPNFTKLLALATPAESITISFEHESYTAPWDQAVARVINACKRRPSQP